MRTKGFIYNPNCFSIPNRGLEVFFGNASIVNSLNMTILSGKYEEFLQEQMGADKPDGDEYWLSPFTLILLEEVYNGLHPNVSRVDYRYPIRVDYGNISRYTDLTSLFDREKFDSLSVRTSNYDINGLVDALSLSLINTKVVTDEEYLTTLKSVPYVHSLDYALLSVFTLTILNAGFPPALLQRVLMETPVSMLHLLSYHAPQIMSNKVLSDYFLSKTPRQMQTILHCATNGALEYFSKIDSDKFIGFFDTVFSDPLLLEKVRNLSCLDNRVTELARCYLNPVVFGRVTQEIDEECKRHPGGSRLLYESALWIHLLSEGKESINEISIPPMILFNLMNLE